MFKKVMSAPHYAGPLEEAIANHFSPLDFARMDAAARCIMEEAFTRNATDDVKKRMYRAWYDFVYDWPTRSYWKERFDYLTSGFKRLLPQATNTYFIFNKDYYWMGLGEMSLGEEGYYAHNDPQLSWELFCEDKTQMAVLVSLAEKDFQERIAIEKNERRTHPEKETIKKIEYLNNGTVLYFPLGWQGSYLLGGIYFSLKEPIAPEEMQCLKDRVYRTYHRAYDGDLIDAVGDHVWNLIQDKK